MLTCLVLMFINSCRTDGLVLEKKAVWPLYTSLNFRKRSNIVKAMECCWVQDSLTLVSILKEYFCTCLLWRDKCQLLFKHNRVTTVMCSLFRSCGKCQMWLFFLFSEWAFCSKKSFPLNSFPRSYNIFKNAAVLSITECHIATRVVCSGWYIPTSIRFVLRKQLITSTQGFYCVHFRPFVILCRTKQFIHSAEVCAFHSIYKELMFCFRNIFNSLCGSLASQNYTHIDGCCCVSVLTSNHEIRSLLDAFCVSCLQ